MKASGRKLKIAILAVVVALLAFFIFCVLAPAVAFLVPMKAIVETAARGRERLFYETNYEELLVACRELAKRVAEGDLKPKRYCVSGDDSDPNASTFPHVILNLEPRFVHIDSHGVVDMELLPAFNFFGVRASPEGQEGWGDVKLIDGLWYYDADYRDEHPKHMRKIDAMIEEGRQRRRAPR